MPANSVQGLNEIRVRIVSKCLLLTSMKACLLKALIGPARISACCLINHADRRLRMDGNRKQDQGYCCHLNCLCATPQGRWLLCVPYTYP